MQYLRLQSASTPYSLLDTVLIDLSSCFWRYPTFNIQAIIIEYVYEKGARELWDIIFSPNAMRQVFIWPWKSTVAILPGTNTRDHARLIANTLLHSWGWSGMVPEHMEFSFIQCPHTLGYFMGGLNVIHLLGDVVVAPFEAIMLRNIAQKYLHGEPSARLLSDFSGMLSSTTPPSALQLLKGCAGKILVCFAFRAAIGLTMTGLYSSFHYDLERRRLARLRLLEKKLEETNAE